MARMGKKRKCAWRKCRKTFVVTIRSQKYCCRAHKNNEGQERLRERASKFVELDAQVNGVMGGGS